MEIMIKILLIRSLQDIKPLEVLDERHINEHFFYHLVKSSIEFCCLPNDGDFFKQQFIFKSITIVSLDAILNDLYMYDILIEEMAYNYRKLIVYLPRFES